MTQNKPIVVVAGAGVLGLAIGCTFAKRECEVYVCEREVRIGSGVSSRNSEVIHAGIYYPSGSLRARHCVTGRRMLYDFAETHKVPYLKTGKLIVATIADEVSRLEALHHLGHANGAVELEMMSAQAALNLEPALRSVAALHSPETGIIDSHALMTALQGEIEDQGGAVVLQTVLTSAEETRGRWQISFEGLADGEIEADIFVNAAGLGAQSLAAKVTGYAAERIPPLRYARGNYFDYRRRSPFHRLVYPTPVPGGLGIHATLDLAGRLRFGPDVEWIETESYDVSLDRLPDFYKSIRRYFPGLEDDSLSPAYAGIRPKLTAAGEPAADFLIDLPKDHGRKGLAMLFGIESPGLTSALSIADEVVMHTIESLS